MQEIFFCDACEAKKYKKCNAFLYPGIKFIDGDHLNEECRKKRHNLFDSSCDLILNTLEKQSFIEHKYWEWFFLLNEKKKEKIQNKIKGSFVDYKQIFGMDPCNPYYTVAVADFPELPINSTDTEERKNYKQELNKRLRLYGASAIKINLMSYILSVFSQKKEGFIINGVVIPFDVKLCRDVKLYA